MSEQTNEQKRNEAAEIEKLQADCAVMRSAIKDAKYDIETANIDWARLNNESPDYDKDYKPEYPPIVFVLANALKSTSGQILLDKVAKSEKENKRLLEACNKWEENEENLLAQITRLRAALKKYGRHRATCRHNAHKGYECTCRLEQATNAKVE